VTTGGRPPWHPRNLAVRGVGGLAVRAAVRSTRRSPGREQPCGLDGPAGHVAQSRRHPLIIASPTAAEGVDVTAYQPLDVTATIGSVTLTAAEGEVIADRNDVARALRTARAASALTPHVAEVHFGRRVYGTI